MDFSIGRSGANANPRMGSPKFNSPHSIDLLSSGLRDISFGGQGNDKPQPSYRDVYRSRDQSQGSPYDPHTDLRHPVSKTGHSDYAMKKMMTLQSGENMMNSLPEKLTSRMYHPNKNFRVEQDRVHTPYSDPYLSKVPLSRSHHHPSGEQVTTLAHSYSVKPQTEIPFRVIDDAYSGIHPNDVVGRLPGRISNEMEDKLDPGQDWKKLIKALDNTRYRVSINDTLKIEEAQVYNGSSTRQLLLNFTDLGMTVYELAQFLDAAQLYSALELIRRPEPLRIVSQPRNKTFIEEGESLTLTCEALGFPYPQYSWFVYDQLKKTSSLHPCNKGVLRIDDIRISDSGQYVCQVRHSQMKDVVQSDWCTVTVLPSNKPKTPRNTRRPATKLEIVEESPWSRITIGNGSSLEIICRAVGNQPTYKWHRNCLPLDGQFRPTLTIREPKFCDSGAYFCVVVDGETKIRSKHFQVKVVLEDKYEETRAEECPIKPSTREVFSPQAKVALLIGMESYRGPHRKLPAAENDVTCLEAHLERLGFMTVSLLNLNKDLMSKHIAWFCELLDEGVYGLFFFIGHGFEYMGQSFLIPMDVPSPCKIRDCISLQGEVLLPILKRDPMLCMAIIDMCRVPPPNMEKGDIPHDYGLPANGKTLLWFATSAGHESYEDRQTKKSYFMQYLDKVIDEPVSILELHEKVASIMSFVCNKTSLVCNHPALVPPGNDLRCFSYLQIPKTEFTAISGWPYCKECVGLEKDPHAGRMQYPQIVSNLIKRYSLHDPVDYHGYTCIMNRRRQQWESATRLPRNQMITFPDGFTVVVSFEKYVSNEMRMITTVTEMGEVSEYTLSLANLPKEIVVRPTECTAQIKPNINMPFSFKSLEKLKDRLGIELQLNVVVSGEKKLISKELELGWPLVSQLQFKMETENNSSFVREKENEPTQQEESCHSGAHHHLV